MSNKLHSNLEEAANRAEATALLIRCGYKVYRPEADTEGEDLVVRTPHGKLVAVQLKSRVYVSQPRYGGKDIWLLVPSASYQPAVRRTWFLVPHDHVFAHVESRHGHSAPTWAGEWSYPSMPRHVLEVLAPFEVKGPLT
jgi:hypothetical protein